MTRKINKEELQKWYTDKGFDPLRDSMLDEMQDEGIIFEMRTTTNGSEYPYINGDNWIRKENIS